MITWLHRDPGRCGGFWAVWRRACWARCGAREHGVASRTAWPQIAPRRQGWWLWSCWHQRGSHGQAGQIAKEHQKGSARLPGHWRIERWHQRWQIVFEFHCRDIDKHYSSQTCLKQISQQKALCPLPLFASWPWVSAHTSRFSFLVTSSLFSGFTASPLIQKLLTTRVLTQREHLPLHNQITFNILGSKQGKDWRYIYLTHANPQEGKGRKKKFLEKWKSRRRGKEERNEKEWNKNQASEIMYKKKKRTEKH